MFISISIVRELERIIAKRKITYLSMKHTWEKEVFRARASA
jgi:hypothetical protein